MSGEFVKVAQISDLPVDASKLVEAGGQKIALFNVAGEIYAIGDTCTHKGGPLNEGIVDGATVRCGWHGAQFDLKTGQNLSPPAAGPVPSYPVEVRGSDIFIQLPSE